MKASQKRDFRRDSRPRAPRARHARRLVVAAAALLLALGWVKPARACPDCAIGRQARTEVWSDDFAFHVCVTVLPFLIIGCVCIALEA
jgi:hypothetical protein